MFRLIPWDVWAATALCSVVIFAAIFEPSPTILMAMYAGLGMYIVAETISDELTGI